MTDFVIAAPGGSLIACPLCGNKSQSWNMPIVHDTKTDKWFYRCTCGWESPRRSREMVDRAACARKEKPC